MYISALTANFSCGCPQLPAMLYALARDDSQGYLPELAWFASASQDSGQQWPLREDACWTQAQCFLLESCGGKALPLTEWLIRVVRVSGSGSMPVECWLAFNEKQQLLRCSLRFPGRKGSQGFAGEILAGFSKAVAQQNIAFSDVAIEIQGLNERGKNSLIHEKNLGAFVPARDGRRMVHRQERELYE